MPQGTLGPRLPWTRPPTPPNAQATTAAMLCSLLLVASINSRSASRTREPSLNRLREG